MNFLDTSALVAAVLAKHHARFDYVPLLADAVADPKIEMLKMICMIVVMCLVMYFVIIRPQRLKGLGALSTVKKQNSNTSQLRTAIVPFVPAPLLSKVALFYSKIEASRMREHETRIEDIAFLQSESAPGYFCKTLQAWPLVPFIRHDATMMMRDALLQKTLETLLVNKHLLSDARLLGAINALFRICSNHTDGMKCCHSALADACGCLVQTEDYLAAWAKNRFELKRRIKKEGVDALLGKYCKLKPSTLILLLPVICEDTQLRFIRQLLTNTRSNANAEGSGKASSEMFELISWVDKHLSLLIRDHGRDIFHCFGTLDFEWGTDEYFNSKLHYLQAVLDNPWRLDCDLVKFLINKIPDCRKQDPLVSRALGFHRDSYKEFETMWAVVTRDPGKFSTSQLLKIINCCTITVTETYTVSQVPRELTSAELFSLSCDCDFAGGHAAMEKAVRDASSNRREVKNVNQLEVASIRDACNQEILRRKTLNLKDSDC